MNRTEQPFYGCSVRFCFSNSKIISQKEISIAQKKLDFYRILKYYDIVLI